MNLSFNTADVRTAQDQGVDVEAIRLAVHDHLVRYFAAAPSVLRDLPETIDAFAANMPELSRLEATYRRAEEWILAELRDVAAPRGTKLEGVRRGALLDLSPLDVVIAGVWGEPVERVSAIVREVKTALLPHQQLIVTVCLGFYRPGGDETPILTEADLCRITEAIAEQGANGILFYNYGEVPRRSLEWIKPALAGVGLTAT